MGGGFAAIDWAVVAAYFAMVFGVAIWASRTETASPQGYFLAGRNTGWFVVGASVFASNIGSEHLVGLAGSGAASGLAVAQFEILAGFILLLLGWLFVPFYLASGVFTMPEWLERRYSAGPRTYLAVISIVSYVLTKISVTVAAGGIVFTTLLGIDFWTGAVVVVVVTGLYTLWGGLKAVLFTDMAQMFVLLAGAATVTLVGYQAVGGWGGLRAALPTDYFTVWRPTSHPDYPWTGILFGAPVLAVWYWCTDQFIVQRVLSAKSIPEARRGAIFAGLLKQLPLFLFVLPGVVAAALVQSGRLELTDADQALPALVEALLPAGLKGLVAAGLLAALMSSLSSVFNSCSTLVTMDIFNRLRPNASAGTLVLAGRVAVGLLVVLGLLWIPFLDVISGELFTYVQSVQAYISPPIAAVFLLGVLWRRANAAGAIAALALGFVLGLGRLIAEINKEALSETLGGALHQFADFNFLHFAFVLFALSLLVQAAVSLATAKPSPERVDGLTVATATTRADAKAGLGPDIVLSLIVIAVIAAVWIVFSDLVM
jgi:SSS family solute:Na+ symporter